MRKEKYVWSVKSNREKNIVTERGTLNELQGSYTVEAAFVFSIILFIVFGIIYVTFHLHDEIVIQTGERSCMQEYVRAENVPISLRKEIVSDKMDLKRKVEKKLLLEEVSKASLTEGAIYIKLSYTRDQVVSLPVFDMINSTHSTENKKLKIHNLPKEIRYYEAFREITNNQSETVAEKK